MLRLVLLVSLGVVAALDNGLGRVPAMGYNTWNDFRCSGISAANVMKVADKMAALDLYKYGYQYLNIDDCWATSRDSTTHEIIPDPTAFPQGMKAVVDYVHSKGFKFGIYTDRGTETCAKRPGSNTFESVDAATYAKWGVDYLKEDSCYASGDHDTAFAEYGTMRDALNATGRPIYFSLCGWNAWYAPQGWSLGNSWRISGDVNQWESVYNALSINALLAQYARPGGWNDPDMLVGSSTGAAVHLTPAQSRTQFSLWSVMAAPLLIGSNMLNMTDYDLQTYTNIEVIDVDQDALGKQGEIVWQSCPSRDLESLRAEARDNNYSDVPSCQQVWAKPLHDGAVAVMFINYAADTATITCDAKCLQAIGISKPSARDLWQHKDLGVLSPFEFSVEGNGASVLVRVSEAGGGVDRRQVAASLVPHDV